MSKSQFNCRTSPQDEMEIGEGRLKIEIFYTGDLIDFILECLLLKYSRKDLTDFAFTIHFGQICLGVSGNTITLWRYLLRLEGHIGAHEYML